MLSIILAGLMELQGCESHPLSNNTIAQGLEMVITLSAPWGRFETGTVMYMFDDHRHMIFSLEDKDEPSIVVGNFTEEEKAHMADDAPLFREQCPGSSGERI